MADSTLSIIGAIVLFGAILITPLSRIMFAYADLLKSRAEHNRAVDAHMVELNKNLMAQSQYMADVTTPPIEGGDGDIPGYH